MFNIEMIEGLNTEVTKFLCIDEVDETVGKHKWTTAAEEQFKNFNSWSRKWELLLEHE